MNIRLEPYEMRHAPFLNDAALESVQELFPFMPWCHANHQLSQAEEFITKAMNDFAQRRTFEFAIVSENGNYLGGCGLNQIDFINLRANLGYWVRTSAIRKGVATDAVRELAAWGWGNTNLNRLEIVVSTENPASQRVAEKSGGNYEGIARSRLMLHGRAHDAWIYSLIRPALRAADPGIAGEK